MQLYLRPSNKNKTAFPTIDFYSPIPGCNIIVTLVHQLFYILFFPFHSFILLYYLLYTVTNESVTYISSCIDFCRREKVYSCCVCSMFLVFLLFTIYIAYHSTSISSSFLSFPSSNNPHSPVRVLYTML